MQNLPILTFHALDGGRDVVALSPRVFRRAIEGFRESGVRTLRLADAVDSLRAGNVPAGSVVLTFDDGYRSVYDVAFPMLQEHGMTGTVYLTVGTDVRGTRLPTLEGRDMLSWPEIREMHRHGLAFGAHTCTHADLTRLSDDRIDDEVCRSKDVIEQALGCPITTFAYPFGRYDRRVREVVQRHFRTACSDRLGFATPLSDPYGLERIDTYYLRTDLTSRLAGTRLLPAYLRLRAGPRRLRRGLRSLFDRRSRRSGTEWR